MSKWTDVRDNVIDALKVEDVTEEAKQQVTKAILEEVLPPLESTVDAFTLATREQAKNETGWCKIRDGVVLPIVMDGMVFIVKTVLEKTMENTVKA